MEKIARTSLILLLLAAGVSVPFLALRAAEQVIIRRQATEEYRNAETGLVFPARVDAFEKVMVRVNPTPEIGVSVSYEDESGNLADVYISERGAFRGACGKNIPPDPGRAEAKPADPVVRSAGRAGNGQRSLQCRVPHGGGRRNADLPSDPLPKERILCEDPCHESRNGGAGRRFRAHVRRSCHGTEKCNGKNIHNVRS